MNPAPPLLGQRYLDEVRLQHSVTTPSQRLQGMSTTLLPNAVTEARYRSRWIVATLDDPETRRAIIDTRQAAEFAGLGELPPIPDRLRLPFAQMWIEPTEGLVLPEVLHEPGHAGDFLIGALMRPGAPVTLTADDGRHVTGECISVSVILRDAAGSSYVDSTFLMETSTGRAITRVGSCRYGEDPSRFFGEESASWDDERMMMARAPHEAPGAIGWWERRVHGFAEFTAWLISYMTAKGVVLVEQRAYEAEYAQTRQQRRAAARAKVKHVPQPWHLVTVLPTHVSERDLEGGTRTVGYRFDVRGHLRLGRHPRKDGTYSEAIEWVPPHQRGLRYSRYVPKTYVYDRDKSPRLAVPSD